MLNKKILVKTVASILIVSQCITLTGCSITKNKKSVIDEALVSTCDSSKLYSGQYYVWHDESQTSLERDINTDLSKFKSYTYDIFRPVYKETDINKNTTEEESDRILWMTDDNESKIPTLYKGDELIFYSNSTLPTSYKLERFYDHGYSIGIYGLTERIKGSGQYVLDVNNTVGVKKNSTAAKVANYLTKDDSFVSIANVGDIKITSKDISKSGTIKGLIHGSQYNVDVYTGTYRHSIKMTADTRIFSSYELFKLTANAYDFVGNGVIKINLPDYLKSGYYCINGAGLFRYVADGTSYDDSTNFNDPIVIKDDNGKIIYDPRTTEKVKTTYSNKDNINDSNISSANKTSIKVSDNNKVIIEAEIKSIINKSIAQTPTISYYVIDSSKTSSDSSSTEASSEPGTKNNPYIIKATAEEMANGKISREISNLPAGSYIFTLDDVSNYSTHTLDVKLQSTLGSSSIGDFNNK